MLGLRQPSQARAWASRVDLSAMQWCEPATLVGIACFVEGELRRGQFVHVVTPTNRSVANYLARMRLGHVLSSLGAVHELPSVSARAADSLLELRIFNGSRGAEQLGRLVDKEVRGSDSTAAGALMEGICETGQNVEQHSGQRFGFIAAQRYRAGPRQPRRFVFAVGDSGHGLLHTLRGQGATTSSDAVRMALAPGISETGDPARGSGLPSIRAYLCELGGGLELLSGDAGVASDSERQDSWSAASALQGTLVQGTISG